MQKAKCAFSNHWIKPADVPDDERIRRVVMLETGWGCLIYGYASTGKFDIYYNNEVDKPIDDGVAYDDAVSLSLGLFALKPKHSSCVLLICPCRIH